MIYVYVAIFIIWLMTLSRLIPKAKCNDNSTFLPFLKWLGYGKLQSVANTAGISINIKTFLFMAIFPIGLSFLLAYMIHNVLFVVVGIVSSLTLPSFVILKYKQHKRKKMLFELPDHLKVLVSKLRDYPSLKLALEKALPDIYGDTHVFFEKAYRGLCLHLPEEKVLQELKKEINIQKFSDFADQLLYAHHEGFHLKALSSLKETIKSMSFDIKMIKGLQIQAKKKYQQLFLVMVMAWVLPFILTAMNSSNVNVFLDQLHGKIFIALFFSATLYCLLQGSNYLSLNLDDL